jgi:hypothetical protein
MKYYSLVIYYNLTVSQRVDLTVSQRIDLTVSQRIDLTVSQRVDLTVSQRTVDYSELIVKKHFMSALN